MKNYKFKVVGTSSINKKFDGDVFESSDFNFSAKNHCFIDMIKDDSIHVFELKLLRFVNKHVVLEGFISDLDKNIGRISLKYLP